MACARKADFVVSPALRILSLILGILTGLEMHRLILENRRRPHLSELIYAILPMTSRFRKLLKISLPYLSGCSRLQKINVEPSQILLMLISIGGHHSNCNKSH